jgi:hypothetical protein
MLRTTSLIGFGSGTSGGLSPLTDITASMWDGSTSGWTLSGNDASKTTIGGFHNIRIKNSAPVLDGDFVWQYTQVGNMGGNTDSSYGFYDISEDSTWASTDYRQGLNSMTNSFWFDTRGTIDATPFSFQPFEGGTSQGSTQTFATDDTFKWQRIGTSLKLFVAGSEKYEWTGVSESLRFCASGFTQNKANISDIQFQN